MSVVHSPCESPDHFAQFSTSGGFEILTSLLASAGDCVKILDLEGRILWMSSVGLRRVGIANLSEIVGTSWALAWTDKYRKRVEDSIQNARTVGAARFEGMMRTASGEEVWWDVSVTAVRGHDGMLQYLLCLSREITERKRTQFELQAHKDHLQLIADNVPALMAYVDCDGKYQWANRVYETWYGLQPREMLGCKAVEVLRERVSPEYADRLAPYMQRALLGERQCFEAKNEVGGRRRELQLTYAPDMALNGEVRGFVLQVTDFSEERRRQSQLRASEERFRTLAAALPSVVWTATVDGQIDYLSDRFYEITGLCTERGLADQWTGVLHPADLPETGARWSSALTSGAVFESRYRVKHRDHGYRWFLARALPQRDESGQITRWVGVTTDIHDQVTAEEAVRESEQRYRLLFEDNPHPMWIYDTDTLRIVAVNDTAVQDYGYPREEFLCLTLADIRPDVDVTEVLERLGTLGSKKTEPVRHRKKDGTAFWVEVTTHPLSAGDGRLSFVLAQDVTQRVRLEAELRWRAQHDALTGAANHSLLAEEFERLRDLAHKEGRRLAILAVDFDRFKQINDTFGHRIGDEFLKTSVERMRKILPAHSTVARIGGDEFAVLTEPMTAEEDCAAVAEALVAAQGSSLRLEELELLSSVSVGIAIFPDDGKTLDDLMRRADFSLYQAKRSGRSCWRRHSAEQEQGLEEATHIERSARLAAAEGRLILHYQPLFAPDGSIRSMEALVRLVDRELGMVSPARFIPIAEECGAINPIGTWVLNEACRQMAAWRAQGRQLVPVAVNVSAAQFARGDFAPEVRRVLELHGLDSFLLELELTESMLMDKVERSREQLHLLRQIGVGIAVDDFGTGYSSLSYLDALPLNTIKIDRSFITSIGTGRASLILKSIIDLGKSMGIGVVAEGVETEEQHQELVRLGCDRLQGYLMGRPAPAAEIESLLPACSGE